MCRPQLLHQRLTLQSHIRRAHVGQTVDDVGGGFFFTKQLAHGGIHPAVAGEAQIDHLAIETAADPQISPDGQWILFNKAPNNSTSYDNPAATTWVVRADGSKPAVQLATADRAAGLTNSWPRWAPFPQTLGTTSEQMWWVTFSSKRDFGVRLDNARRVYQRPSDGMPAKLAQIWMTPFFPGRADAGAEPSGPAFRLPFQDLVTSNHIPQWTEKVVVIQ